MVVITGVSGSGKSSLAFDTLYAEGQRRYIESLSAYARQFLNPMDKPDVDFIEGLSPAISIDQKSAPRNPRSTVGTITEIYDYLRLLFARIGIPHCPKCGKVVSRQTTQQIVERILEFPEGKRIHVLAPLVRGRKGEYRKLIEEVRRQGFARVRVDGVVYRVEEAEKLQLDRYKQHNIEIVVDRIAIREGIRSRLADSIETASRVGKGIVIIEDADTGEEHIFSEHFSCPDCGIDLPEMEPRIFSFNSPYGACPTCDGLGVVMEFDPDLVIPDKNLSIAEGAIVPWKGRRSNFKRQILKAVAEHYGFSIHTPIKKLTKRQLNAILYGTDEPVYVTYRTRHGRIRSYYCYFEGVINSLRDEYENAESDYIREELQKFMAAHPCPDCKGARLKPESLAVTVGGKNIYEVTQMTVRQCLEFFEDLERKLTERERIIARQILKEIKHRLQFLIDVGLDYLTLDRRGPTLAGGEAQRIRLATQIGSGLTGVLYILDEPTIGLHARDTVRLVKTLHRLRDLGNTIIVVEHDETTIRSADWIIDLGPGAGEKGGRVVVAGTVEDVEKCPESITGQYLSGKREIPVPERRRKPSDKWLIIKGARQYNLKNIDVRIPLGLFVCVTGVSGSGKSTLVDEILYRRLAHKLHGVRTTWGEHDDILGTEHIDKVINIDQSPIGRTPRSNPATYTGVFTHIRQLFAQLPEARARGYKPGRFSFNVRGGRCEACQGEGLVKVEMHWLPDVYVPCEVCKGKRFNEETLQVKYKGKSIADVLDMTVDEALELFAHIPPIKRILQTLHDVGLGYIKLGQPATTLSGGEAQRVKLAAELCRKSTGRTLYILDEPTVGLHFEDVKHLLNVLHRLVDQGNTVIVIEHQLDVIKTADWIIDLGPEGGERGGYIVAEGPPEEVAKNPNSYTGRFLRKYLNRNLRRRKAA